MLKHKIDATMLKEKSYGYTIDYIHIGRAHEPIYLELRKTGVVYLLIGSKNDKEDFYYHDLDGKWMKWIIWKGVYIHMADVHSREEAVELIRKAGYDEKVDWNKFERAWLLIKLKRDAYG